MVDLSHTSGSKRGGYYTPRVEDDDDERHAQFIRRHRYLAEPFPRTSTLQSSPPDETDGPTPNAPTSVVWRKRIRHFTWTFFTMTMATGGVANVLHTGSDFRSSNFSERAYRADTFDTSPLPL